MGKVLKAKRSRKAGISIGAIVSVILILIAGGLVAFPIYYKFAQKASVCAGLQQCRMSYQDQSITNIDKLAFNYNTPIKLNCPRYFLRFENGEIQKNKCTSGIEDIEMSEDPADDKKKEVRKAVHKTLYNEMKNCWWQMLEGKNLFFPMGEKALDIGNNNQLCFVCDEITFSNDFPLNKVEGFGEYLRGGENAKIDTFENEKSLCNKKYKYRDQSCRDGFIKSYGGSIKNNEATFRDNPIKTNKKYLLLFVRNNMDNNDPAETTQTLLLLPSNIVFKSDTLCSMGLVV